MGRPFRCAVHGGLTPGGGPIAATELRPNGFVVVGAHYSESGSQS